MMKGLTIAMVAGMVLAAVPPVTAFHGSPYQLTGTALFKPTGQLWNAVFAWSGAGGVNGGTFRVTLSDPVSGAKMPAISITGRESIPVEIFPWNMQNCAALEVIAHYAGTDTQSNGKMLDVKGVQENCLGSPRNGDRYMHVVGTVMQYWDVNLNVGSVFATQYEF